MRSKLDLNIKTCKNIAQKFSAVGKKQKPFGEHIFDKH